MSEGCDGGAGADVLPDRDRHGVCVIEIEQERVCVRERERVRDAMGERAQMCCLIVTGKVVVIILVYWIIGSNN